MSERTKGRIQPPKKEESKKTIEVLKEDLTEIAILELKDMFSQFLISSNQTQASNRTDINELKEAIKSLNRSSAQSPIGNESMDTPLPVRTRGSRRSSMFFGISQNPSTPQISDTLLIDTPLRSNIQVLQADNVYDKELKVSSLEGLQYLARQLQLFLPNTPVAKLNGPHGFL